MRAKKAPLTKRQLRKHPHPFMTERQMEGAFVVLRIDDYHSLAANRGQFYPVAQRHDDCNKAIWPTEAKAMEAAGWATKEFGHVYGVFKMIAVVERTVAPIQVSKV